MGSTNKWDEASYRSYSDTVKSASATSLFRNRSGQQQYSSAAITCRESCDSQLHPNSTAIIIGLDVSGSMGKIAVNMAKNGIGEFMKRILQSRVISDPHVMFMGIGDVLFDQYPLQATQFEPDMVLLDQLTSICLEGGGGDNESESYHLAWYFAALKTRIDCFEKRQKKGYLFTIGDELPFDGITTVSQLAKCIIPSGASTFTDITTKDALILAQQKYHVFHILVESGSYFKTRSQATLAAWRELMGGHAVLLSNERYLPQVLEAVIRVNEGDNVDLVISEYMDRDPIVGKCIQHALKD
jgi:hypothetical protein